MTLPILHPDRTGTSASRSRPWLVPFVLLLAAHSVFAYDFSTSNAARWPDGEVIFHLRVGSPGGTLIDGSTSWETPAIGAMGDWDAYLEPISLAYVSNSSIPADSGDDVNTIAFSSTIFGRSWGRGTIGICVFYLDGSGITEADILLNSNESWNSYRGNLRFAAGGGTLNDFRRTVLHELGHALGLDHPDEAGQNVAAIMNSVSRNYDSLQQDDIDGIIALYGGTAPTPAPATGSTSSPAPTPGPVGSVFESRFGPIVVLGDDGYFSDSLGTLYGAPASGWLWSASLNDWVNATAGNVYALNHGYLTQWGDGWAYSSRFGWIRTHSFDSTPPAETGWFYSIVYGWMYHSGGFHYLPWLNGWIYSSDSGTHYSYGLGFITGYDVAGIVYSDRIGWTYIGDYGGQVYAARFGWLTPNGDATYFYSDTYGWLVAFGGEVVYSLTYGYFLP